MQMMTSLSTDLKNTRSTDGEKCGVLIGSQYLVANWLKGDQRRCLESPLLVRKIGSTARACWVTDKLLKSNTCCGDLVIERASTDNIYVKASSCNIQFSNLWSYFCTILFLCNLFCNLSNVLSFYYFYFILVFTGLAILFIHCYLFRSLIIFPHCYPFICNSLGYSKLFYNHFSPLDLGSLDGI